MIRIGIAALVVLLLLGGCQGSRPILPEQTYKVSALYGTDISLLEYSIENEVIELGWASVSSTGQYIRIQLPPGIQVYQASWDSSDGFINAVIPQEGFIDVGVVALDGYGGMPAKLRIEPGRQGKTSSNPPVGGYNEVDHIVAYQLDAGTPAPNSVRLEWAEMNTGDYDFNGEVNVADIAPLAIHFGKTYQKTSTTRREQTVYWVDGDRNGEVNLADITPIATNINATVDGYNIYKGLGSPIRINRVEAQSRSSNGYNLPPLYSALVSGLATDSWKVAPVDKENTIGALSQTVPIVVEQFNAIGSLVITGLDLYQFASGTNGILDSGFSLMRIIDPGEDIDSIEIGDIIEGSDGSFVLHNMPIGQELALEVTFAPVLNLLTGQAFSENPVDNEALSLASPVTIRSLFSIPASGLSLQPRIDLTPDPVQGYNIDLTVNTSWDTGLVQYDARLDYFNFRVAAKPVSMGDYRIRPLLRDTNRDMISNAKIQKMADLVDYPAENTVHIQYRGRITSFDEPGGTLVMADPWVIDDTKPAGGYIAPESTIEFNFTEYTLFTDEVDPFFFVPVDMLHSEVVINSSQLNGEGFGGLPTKWWATSITRTEL